MDTELEKFEFTSAFMTYIKENYINKLFSVLSKLVFKTELEVEYKVTTDLKSTGGRERDGFI